MRLVALFALLAACLHGVPAAAKAPYPFSVSAERNGRNHDLVARNRGPAPVSVRLTLPVSDNVRPTQPLPFYAVIGPHSEAVLLTLGPADPGRGTRFSLQTSFQLGSYHAVPDPRATCRLPFADGISAVVGQAPGGPITSHAAPDSEEAIDFTMPPHTPVVAARDGTVIETEASNLFGGQDRTLVTMANYVRILHADGTIATYAHLSPGGVKVVAGQRVGAGTVIGASGATGYASGPHLHFVVQRLVRQNDGFAMVSVPVRFHAGNPPVVFVPRFGQRTTADYPAPAGPPAAVNEKRAAGAR
jgi:murein DD-endopeptidase MepM/ murein hydrolase activator NlpD